MLEQLLFKIKQYKQYNPCIIFRAICFYFPAKHQLHTCLLDLSVQIRCVSFTSNSTSWENQGNGKSHGLFLYTTKLHQLNYWSKFWMHLIIAELTCFTCGTRKVTKKSLKKQLQLRHLTFPEIFDFLIIIPCKSW